MCICLHCVGLTSRCAIVMEMESEKQQRGKEILRTFLENPDLSHRAINRKLGMVHSTVSRLFNRYHERLTIDRKENSGKIDLRIVFRVTNG